jgi:NCAIR mutase (PurE)-related protein
MTWALPACIGCWQRDRLNAASVIVVAAGMDGALPTIVGGIGGPVIAVPTSIGYGTAWAAPQL